MFMSMGDFSCIKRCLYDTCLVFIISNLNMNLGSRLGGMGFNQAQTNVLACGRAE